MIESPKPNEAVLIDEAAGHSLPTILEDRELPVEGLVVGAVGTSDELFAVTLTEKHMSRVQVHRAQLYPRLLRFETGKLIFEWVARAGVVVLEHQDSGGNGLTIESPWGKNIDRHQFEDWCREFVGIG